MEAELPNADLSGHEREAVAGVESNPSAEAAPFTVEPVFEPFGVRLNGSVCSKAADLGSDHAQGLKFAGGGIHVGKIPQTEIAAKSFVTAHAFTIV